MENIIREIGAIHALLQLSQVTTVSICKSTETPKLKRKREMSTEKPQYQRLKPYRCTKCGMQKPDSTAIKYHCTIHIEQTLKPFSCTLCSKYTSFTLPNIRKHLTGKHKKLIGERDNFMAINKSKKEKVAQLVSGLYIASRQPCSKNNS